MGAVLFQDHGVIGYYSKKFNTIEQNYSIVEKELFAILKSLEFHRNLIQAYTIQIETDGRNCIFENKVISKRTERWKLILNEFDLTIRNIKETENNIADKLSRCFYVDTEKHTDLYMIVRGCLETEEDTLVKDERNRYVVKENKEVEFVTKVHEWSVHARIYSLYNNNIKERYFIKNIKNTIEKVVKACEMCLRNKRCRKRKMKKYRITSNKLMEILSSDIFAPFDLLEYDKSSQVSGEKGFCLTITDVYSRFTVVKFL
ncbi:Transposon Tf2-8 polyprotein [Nosema granulosis]|uniref:Transposon Tf2-8 polyprotein n=1 Tax=Nosema granulosis TaxID=83296 RepID=A0A9P6KY94_9MICR|nr:Transposon Tf2-8 polyprotein [Nosema granulosis]